jgi:3-hydroxyacyl-CoA dehydrogenase
MAEGIRCAAVIGAGVMGSAIAAHLAGAGLRVHLFDIVPPHLDATKKADANARNAIADGGLKKALGAKPAAFFDPDAARLIQTGNLADHLARLAECDLVIEAIPEDLSLKQKLFAAICPHLAPQAVLASNTSGLSIKQMSDALPEALRSRFLVLHFFNPVRYMRLVEVVAAPETNPELVSRMVRFGEFLGKGVVLGKDTTNFVANRIGVYSLMFALHSMLEHGLDIETVDEIVGKPMGRPKSAAFKTADIVGVDTLSHVAKNCYDSLAGDPERDVFKMPAFVEAMAKAGALGRKTGAGFYKKVGKEIQVLDLATQQYRAPHKVEFDSLSASRQARGVGARIKALISGDDAASKFAWVVVEKTLLYAAGLVGEIADDIVSIDRAMRWGFNWDLGPFQVWDAIGVAEACQRMKADGLSVPGWVETMLQSGQERFYAGSVVAPTFYDPAASAHRPVPTHPKQFSIAQLKAEPKNIVRENRSASLVDLGQGVLCLELHTKMNTLDAEAIEMVSAAVTIAEDQFSALLVANDAEHFSAGANLMMIGGAAQAGKWEDIDQIIRGLQQALQQLRYCGVPVVSAPCRYTLGGGAELAMASDASQAFAETYMGLVEVGVGLIPAGCGCLRMVERYTAPVRDIEGVDLLPLIAQASLNIAMAKASTSAQDAKRLRYLRPSDGISLNRDFLLFEARAVAQGMAQAGYRAPQQPLHRAAGFDAAKTIAAKVWGMVEGRWASPHDALIANKVAHVLCGGMVAAGTLLSEQHYLDLEREAFLQLCGEKKTQERIEHMLKTGKPLRN